MSGAKKGWDLAQLRTSFLADPEFQRLRSACRSDQRFLEAIGVWTMALAQAWREDDPDVGDLLEGWPKQAERLVAAGLVVDGSLVGFEKWTAAVRERRQIDVRRKAMNANDELTRAIRARDGDTCRYCGDPVNFKDRRSPKGGTYDHVLPIDQGGGESVANLVVCCRSCNNRKGARTPEQARMTLLPPIHPDLSGSGRSYPDLDRGEER